MEVKSSGTAQGREFGIYVGREEKGLWLEHEGEGFCGVSVPTNIIGYANPVFNNGNWHCLPAYYCYVPGLCFLRAQIFFCAGVFSIFSRYPENAAMKSKCHQSSSAPHFVNNMELAQQLHFLHHSFQMFAAESHHLQFDTGESSCQRTLKS